MKSTLHNRIYIVSCVLFAVLSLPLIENALISKRGRLFFLGRAPDGSPTVQIERDNNIVLGFDAYLFEIANGKNVPLDDSFISLGLIHLCIEKAKSPSDPFYWIAPSSNQSPARLIVATPLYFPPLLAIGSSVLAFWFYIRKKKSQASFPILNPQPFQIDAKDLSSFPPSSEV